MRIDIFAAGQHVFTEAFNGTIGWQWRSGGDKPIVIQGTNADALRHGIELPGHIYTLLDMQKNGHDLDYIGQEQWQGTSTNLMKLTLKDGHQKFYVLDAKTGVILANRDLRAFHPDIDNTQVVIETRPADYRQFHGMKRSFQAENWDLTNNKSLGSISILNLTMNRPMEDGYFEIDNFLSLGEKQNNHKM